MQEEQSWKNPLLISKVYKLICDMPGIDTPNLCLHTNPTIEDPTLTEPNLAKWLMENSNETWNTTCQIVDGLLEEGSIIFTDSGKLYQTGYQGKIDE